MKWRDVVAAIAHAARMREEGSRGPVVGPNDAEAIAHRRGAQWAFGVVAAELEYIAGLPAHEGLAHVRELAARGKKS